MTDRLNAAINKLSLADIERITEIAERLAEVPSDVEARRPMKLDWVGGMSDAPEQSGLEAQETAKNLWLAAIDRSLR